MMHYFDINGYSRGEKLFLFTTLRGAIIQVDDYSRGATTQGNIVCIKFKYTV